MVELDVQGAALLADRDGQVEAAVLLAQRVEHAQRGPGERAEFPVVPLGLELGDDDDGQHHLVLGESLQ